MSKSSGMSPGISSFRGSYLLVAMLLVSILVSPVKGSDKDIAASVDGSIDSILRELYDFQDAVTSQGPDSPTAPTDSPTAPTDSSTAPTDSPTAPTDLPTAPTDLTSESTDLTSESTESSSGSTESSSGSTESSSGSTQSSSGSTDSTIDSSSSSQGQPLGLTDSSLGSLDLLPGSSRINQLSGSKDFFFSSLAKVSSSAGKEKIAARFTDIEVCTSPIPSCNRLNDALNAVDNVAQEFARNIFNDDQVTTIQDAETNVSIVCNEPDFIAGFQDPNDIANLNLAIEAVEADSSIVKTTRQDIEDHDTTVIVSSVVGSFLILAVIGLSIALGIIGNKYNKTKKQPKTSADSAEMQDQTPGNNSVGGAANAAFVVEGSSLSGRKTPGFGETDPTAQPQTPGPYDPARVHPGPGPVASAPYDRDHSGTPSQIYEDPRYQDSKPPVNGSQAPKPYYGDPKVDNTQMRSLGGSYPPSNRGNPPPSRNPSRGPYGEPLRAKDPYSPNRRSEYDRRRSGAPSQYSSSSQYQDRPAPGSSRYQERPSGYSDRSSAPLPPQRSPSYKAPPSSGAGSRPPPRSRSDIKGPYGPEDLY